MERVLNNIISNEYFPSSTVKGDYNLIVADVTANGKRFIESYVGVKKGHPFFSIYEFIEQRDKRWENIQYHIFTKFGAMKEFASYAEMLKYAPIDGTYLSFARSGKVYDFLDDDYFYYGSGINVGIISSCTEEACIEAANIINDRMLAYLREMNNTGYLPSPECLPEDVYKLLKVTPYWKQTIYSYHGQGSPITKKLIDENIVPHLYEFKSESNQKAYIIHPTALCIACNGTVYNDTRTIGWSVRDKQLNMCYSDAVHEGLSVDGLAVDDVNMVSQMLWNVVHHGPYWKRVLSTLHKRINKHDRNNIRFVLSRHYES